MCYRGAAMQRNVIRATASGWEGVEPSGYAPDGSGTGVVRHTLVGDRKADRSEPGPQMELRYFEVRPGAASRLEKHEHEHYVIVKTGSGYAIVGDKATEIAPGDVVYVGATSRSASTVSWIPAATSRSSRPPKNSRSSTHRPPAPSPSRSPFRPRRSASPPKLRARRARRRPRAVSQTRCSCSTCCTCTRRSCKPREGRRVRDPPAARLRR